MLSLTQQTWHDASVYAVNWATTYLADENNSQIHAEAFKTKPIYVIPSYMKFIIHPSGVSDYHLWILENRMI